METIRYQNRVLIFFACFSLCVYGILWYFAPILGLHCLAVKFIPGALFFGAVAFGLKPVLELRHIPTARVDLWGGHLGQYQMDQQYRFVQRIVKQYGPVTKLVRGRRTIVLINDPDLIREVFVDKFKLFHSRPNQGISKSQHLFNQEGDEWRKSRSTLAPSFNTQNLTRFTEDLNTAGREFVERLRKLNSGEVINAWRWYGGLTLQAICATSFGRTVRQEDISKDPVILAMQTILGTTTAKTPSITPYIMMFPIIYRILRKLPLPTTAHRIKKAMKAINDYTDSMADELSKNQGEIDAKQAKSFLNIMINAKDKDTGEKLEPKEIKDQSFLFILAGYETTANTLAFASYSLATNPDAQKKLVDEIDSVCGDDKDSDISYQDLKKFVYLDWVIQETLRLFPPVPMMMRKAYENTQLGGFDIPDETWVGIPTFSIHRDKRIYGPDADNFRPERWDPDTEEFQQRHKYAWFPFGEGPRKCIGYRFALEELKIVLVNVFRHYTFEWPKGAELKLRAPATLGPSETIPLIPVARK